MSGDTGVVRLLLFGWVRERAGTGEAGLPLAAPATIGQLLDRIAALSPALALALADRHELRFALNQAVVSPDAVVHPGDELAIFPPVTGG